MNAAITDTDRINWLEAHPLPVEVRGGPDDGHTARLWGLVAAAEKPAVALPKAITIKVPAFMLWESARSKAMTSDDWCAAMEELERQFQRETQEDGSTVVYEMIEACLERMAENGAVREMTMEELSADAECPFYALDEQATQCAGCGAPVNTPLRNDAMGGYVCLTCINRELEKLQSRLHWLHDCSTGQTDAAGYEWGIYRVKWENGKAMDVRATNSDFSDLDAEMTREAGNTSNGQ